MCRFNRRDRHLQPGYRGHRLDWMIRRCALKTRCTQGDERDSSTTHRPRPTTSDSRLVTHNDADGCLTYLLRGIRYPALSLTPQFGSHDNPLRRVVSILGLPVGLEPSPPRREQAGGMVSAGHVVDLITVAEPRPSQHRPGRASDAGYRRRRH